MGVLNVPFCSIFVTISFLCYNDIGCAIFMVLLISALVRVGAKKPCFLDSGSSWGEGVHVWVGMVCYHCLVCILNSSKNSIFCVLRTYSGLCFVPN